MNYTIIALAYIILGYWYNKLIQKLVPNEFDWRAQFFTILTWPIWATITLGFVLVAFTKIMWRKILETIY